MVMTPSNRIYGLYIIPRYGIHHRIKFLGDGYVTLKLDFTQIGSKLVKLLLIQ